MLAWDSDNEPVLPTLKTVLKLKGDVRISNELTRELNGLDDYLDVVRVAPFLSDPTVEDTDSDGLIDDKDANPLHAFNSDFILTDNISEIPSNFNIDNKEQIAKEIYNTYSTYEKWEMRRDLGDFYRDAQLNVVGGPIFGYKNAAIFLNHFLENTGEDYYFDAREIIENTSNGHDVYIKNINNVMTLCEDTVVDELSFITNYNVRFPGINFTSGGSEAGDVNALDWQYCVGDADTVMAFNCISNREMYTLTINYYILDYYDWKKGSETRGGLVTDGQMYMLHKAGRAKEYRVIGIYSDEITWKRGERIE